MHETKPMNSEQLRQQHLTRGISASDFDADPVSQFAKWYDEAVATCEHEWMEANAVTLATSDLTGYMSVRTVLLKGHGPDGFTFFTNYASQKGRQLAVNPRAALLFYWAHLSRQVRIEGTVTKVSRESSLEYFHSRHRGSQLSAAISAQSQTISSREELERKVADLEQSLNGQPVPLPDNWGGYLLSPNHFEFWQGRHNRLHDRLIYVPDNDQWRIERLQP